MAQGNATFRKRQFLSRGFARRQTDKIRVTFSWPVFENDRHRHTHSRTISNSLVVDSLFTVEILDDLGRSYLRKKIEILFFFFLKKNFVDMLKFFFASKKMCFLQKIFVIWVKSQVTIKQNQNWGLFVETFCEAAPNQVNRVSDELVKPSPQVFPELVFRHPEVKAAARGGSGPSPKIHWSCVIKKNLTKFQARYKGPNFESLRPDF
jgi:hypothetical protein